MPGMVSGRAVLALGEASNSVDDPTGGRARLALLTW
jgi:hypothetical protein